MRSVKFEQPWQLPPVPLMAYPLYVPRILLYRLLPLRVVLRLAVLHSRFEMQTQPERRRRLEAVLKPLLPDGTSLHDLRRKVVLSRAMRRIGTHTYAPVFRRSKEWLLRTFQPEGLEGLDEVKRSGRGAVILATHAGINGWVAPILNQLGYKTLLMQRPAISPHRLLTLRWDKWDAHVIPHPGFGHAGVHLKRLHSLLRRGEWIQYGGDVSFKGKGVEGQYLGRPVRCGPAPWALGRLAGVPVIPTLMLADERLRPRLIIGPPINVREDLPPEDAGAGAFQTYLDFISRKLAPAPWNISLADWERLLANAGHP